MTRTRVAAAGLSLLGLGLALPLLVSGCAVGGGITYASGGGGAPRRPPASYYCADCHGVSYFDPYYDLCMKYGYRFNWRASPEVYDAYRRDYTAIKRANPDVGRYRYPRGAKEDVKERFADDQGRMPKYDASAPTKPPARATKKKDGPPRGPKATTSETKEKRTSPPRGEKRGVARGTNQGD